MVDGDCRFLDIDVSYIVLFPTLNLLLENQHLYYETILPLGRVWVRVVEIVTKLLK